MLTAGQRRLCARQPPGLSLQVGGVDGVPTAGGGLSVVGASAGSCRTHRRPTCRRAAAHRPCKVFWSGLRILAQVVPPLQCRMTPPEPTAHTSNLPLPNRPYRSRSCRRRTAEGPAVPVQDPAAQALRGPHRVVLAAVEAVRSPAGSGFPPALWPRRRRSSAPGSPDRRRPRHLCARCRRPRRG